MEAVNSTNTTSDFVKKLNFDFLDTIYKVAIGTSIVETIGMIVCNGLLLITIFTSPKLRTNLQYILVCSVALGDLLIGSLGLPAVTDFIIQKQVTVRCEFHVILQILLNHGHVNISLVGLFMISAYYVLKQYSVPMPELGERLQRSLSIFLAILPWFLTCIVNLAIVPIGMNTMIYKFWSANSCPLHLQMWASNTIFAISFCLPVIFITIASVLIIRKWYSVAHGTDAFQPHLMQEERVLIHPKYIIIINTISILLLLPVQLVQCTKSSFPNIKLLVITIFTTFEISLFKAVVLPAIWLIVPEVRQEFLVRCKISYWRRSNESLRHVVNKTYQEYKEDEQKQEKGQEP